MGLFKKKAPNGTVASHNTLNAFLGRGTEYFGRLEFGDTVRIDGTFRGEIASNGTLVLGRNAVVDGHVQVGTLISNGRVNGEVTASCRAILRKNSLLTGSLSTPTLVVEEGALLEGTVTMGPDCPAAASVITLRPSGRESAPALDPGPAKNQS